MTRIQIEAAKKTLPKYTVVPWKDWTPEQKQLSEELQCREMINSCLLYGGIEGFWREYDWRVGDKSYATPYIRAFGRERVEELVREQEADFAQARIYRCVFTDSEGCTYDSIEWADEFQQRREAV